MAKAKKSETTSPKSATPAKKSEGGAKKSAKPSTGGSPLIDTDFAASAAARMIMARKPAAATGDNAKSETSAFKQLKENLAKPHATTMSNLLNKTSSTDGKKSQTPFGQKQVGHNQTFGADVNRTGVPRRTGG